MDYSLLLAARANKFSIRGRDRAPNADR